MPKSCLSSKGWQAFSAELSRIGRGHKGKTSKRVSRSEKAATGEQREKGKIGKLAVGQGISHSALFHASLANGKMATKVLTDEGSDANILPYSVHKDLKKVFPDLKVSTLERPVLYRDVSEPACATCDKQVTLDIYLKVRHGSNLTLPDITCSIPQEELNSPNIGRRVLESIGCDNRIML